MQRDKWADILGAVFDSVADNDTPEQSAPAFFVETDGGAHIVLSACDAYGRWKHLSACTPTEELLRAVEIDYTQLRDEVMRLWEQYPLDGTDQKKELARLSEEVRETSELLREIDPRIFLCYTAVGAGATDAGRGAHVPGR